jgi:hypothetical protein
LVDSRYEAEKEFHTRRWIAVTMGRKHLAARKWAAATKRVAGTRLVPAVARKKVASSANKRIASKEPVAVRKPVGGTILVPAAARKQVASSKPVVVGGMDQLSRARVIRNREQVVIRKPVTARKPVTVRMRNNARKKLAEQTKKSEEKWLDGEKSRLEKEQKTMDAVNFLEGRWRSAADLGLYSTFRSSHQERLELGEKYGKTILLLDYNRHVMEYTAKSAGGRTSEAGLIALDAAYEHVMFGVDYDHDGHFRKQVEVMCVDALIKTVDFVWEYFSESAGDIVNEAELKASDMAYVGKLLRDGKDQ